MEVAGVLDELIRSTEGAHNGLLDLEELAEDELERIRKRYEALAERARDDLRRGLSDTGRPRIGRIDEADGSTHDSD